MISVFIGIFLGFVGGGLTTLVLLHKMKIIRF